MSEKSWTVERLLNWTTDYFKNQGIESARLDTELLLSHCLGWERIKLYTHFDQPLSDEERAPFRSMVKRRAKQEPIAYILGNAEFYGRTFKVNSNVLIPRPETEHIIEHVLEDFGETQSVLDIGTGSGVLAITLALECPSAKIYASDISKEALGIAKENAAELGAQVEFRAGDLCAPWTGMHFDMIVSNPPYVETTFTPEANVKDYEPHGALFSGEDGLNCLRKLVPQAKHHLKTGGSLVSECGHQQGAALEQLCLNAGFIKVSRYQDLAGHERGVIARL